MQMTDPQAPKGQDAPRYVATDLDPPMRLDPIGAWVHWDDYAKAQARVAKLEAERDYAFGWAKTQHAAADEYADRVKAAEARVKELEGAQSLVQNCTIDLRGAGYKCVAKDENGWLGDYNEGDKVMCEGSRVFLDGLHILGPTRIAEMNARAESAEARERALLASNNDTRSALVENASLRTRLKAAEVALATAGDDGALEQAAALMDEWADEAQANMDASDPSNFNLAREVERDTCREAAQKIRALKGGA